MEKYVKRNLMKDEKIVKQAKIHWALLIPSILKACIIIGIPKLIVNIIAMNTTELAVTNKKILGKIGLINTKVMDSPLNKINNVSVSSGLFGKLFHFGTVNITTASGEYHFVGIADPDDFRATVMNEIEQYDQDRIKKQAEEMAKAIKH